jgi:hypothetical protein
VAGLVLAATAAPARIVPLYLLLSRTNHIYLVPLYVKILIYKTIFQQAAAMFKLYPVDWASVFRHTKFKRNYPCHYTIDQTKFCIL